MPGNARANSSQSICTGEASNMPTRAVNMIRATTFSLHKPRYGPITDVLAVMGMSIVKILTGMYRHS